MAKKQAQISPDTTESKPNVFARFARYVDESKAELRKVTWPTPVETRKATLAVLGFVAVMAVILGLVDFGLSSLIKFILS
ncbi:MAG: preprotein translocase subunit SecE [Desulfovibrio sp.]|nr:preprotein translocase subunit SecE [Desulfovibrio sp.]